MTLGGYFAGSPAAVALTAAMIIFFWSGECYHRAWAHGGAPDLRLNKRGDSLSGYGALVLGIGLMALGQPLLAATAGLLHALGKFGSGYGWSGPSWMWPALVPASRVPALLAILLELSAALNTGADWLTLAGPLSVLGSYLLWIAADFRLMRPMR